MNKLRSKITNISTKLCWNKKGFIFLATEVARIIMAVLVSLLLIGLIVALYFFVSPDKDIARAESEMGELRTYLSNVKIGEEIEYPVLYAPNWYLYSTDVGRLCDGDFCLCICEDEDCSGVNICKEIDKYVMLQLNGNLARSVKLIEKPGRLTLSLKEINVYPFTAKIESTIFERNLPPVLFMYEGEWKWGLDAVTWRGLDDLNNGAAFISTNNFIKNVLVPVEDSKNGGELILKRNDIHISEGIYIANLESTERGGSIYSLK
jgi:hypothetical protein